MEAIQLSMQEGKTMITLEIQSVADNILNSPMTRNNVPIDVISDPRTRNAIMASLLHAASEIKRYERIVDQIVFNMKRFGLIVEFKDDACLIKKDSGIILSKKTFRECRYMESYDENKYVNTFLNSFKVLDFYDLFDR